MRSADGFKFVVPLPLVTVIERASVTHFPPDLYCSLAVPLVAGDAVSVALTDAPLTTVDDATTPFSELAAAARGTALATAVGPSTKAATATKPAIVRTR